MEKIPDGYKKDAQGRLVPIEMIKDVDLVRDALVTEIVEKAKELAARIIKVKSEILGDIEAFIELSAEKYDAPVGGAKGNVSLPSFDGKYRVLRAVSERLEFDERLQAAKALIDECLREWTTGSNAKIQALINDAFQVDKKGRINTKRILSLRRLEIEDEKWSKAMQAISDSLTVMDSMVYVRIYERNDRGEYNQIRMDMSGA